MDLLWIIENQISENPRNEHLKGNLQIDWSNEIQILQFICQWKSYEPEESKETKMIEFFFVNWM